MGRIEVSVALSIPIVSKPWLIMEPTRKIYSLKNHRPRCLVIHQHKVILFRLQSSSGYDYAGAHAGSYQFWGYYDLYKSRISQVNGTLAGADWIGKTGTTNTNGDMWLMLSTPKMTLGGWIGHDDM